MSAASKQRSRQIVYNQIEKTLRMDEDHLRYLAVTDPKGYRLESIITFRKEAERLLNEHPHLKKCRRALWSLSEIPPWRRGLNRNIVYPYLHCIKGRGDSAEEIRLAVLNRLRELDAVYNIYTTVQPRRAFVITTVAQPSSTASSTQEHSSQPRMKKKREP